MSQSENSEDSMTTTCPVQFVDMSSVQESEEEGEVEITMGKLEPTTIVTQEEIETMLKCTMRAIDSNSEVMNILLHLNRMCGIVLQDDKE